jgi:hypothetical protein
MNSNWSQIPILDWVTGIRPGARRGYSSLMNGLVSYPDFSNSPTKTAKARHALTRGLPAATLLDARERHSIPTAGIGRQMTGSADVSRNLTWP